MAMSRRKARKAPKASVTLIPATGMDADDFHQQFKRWQEERRFLIAQHPDLAEKARKLGILPSRPTKPPTEHS